MIFKRSYNDTHARTHKRGRCGRYGKLRYKQFRNAVQVINNPRENRIGTLNRVFLEFNFSTFREDILKRELRIDLEF